MKIPCPEELSRNKFILYYLHYILKYNFIILNISYIDGALHLLKIRFIFININRLMK